MNSRFVTRRRTGFLAAGLVAQFYGTTFVKAQMPSSTISGNIFTVDVRDFGARGDGIADDTAAINRAIAHLKEKRKSIDAFPIGPKLIFPPGIYLVKSSINLTNLQILNMVLEGNGSVIVGACAGEPVIDAMGSRWLMVRDLVIIGDQLSMPSVGIQIGRTTDAVADNHRFVDLKVVGHFGLACLVNVAAETTGFDHIFLWNYNKNINSYCLIQDGLNHFRTASKFVATRTEQDRDDSFNENEFINCDFRHAGGGIPIFLGETSRHRFYRCYAVGIGKAVFMIYCGHNSHDMLEIDCHCETGALRSIFLFSGSLKCPIVRGFSFKDHAPFATNFIFSCDGSIEHVTLEHVKIEIGFYPSPNCRVFEHPPQWTITGSYYSSMKGQWNAGQQFKGTIYLGSSVE